MNATLLENGKFVYRYTVVAVVLCCCDSFCCTRLWYLYIWTMSKWETGSASNKDRKML